MFRSLWFVALTVICLSTSAKAQTPSTDLAFDVASVKAVDPSYRFDGKRFWAHVNAGGASYWYMSVNNLVGYAYGVESLQVAGPEWAGTEHFDIEAKFAEGTNRKQEHQMMQGLLKDRFALSFHVEKRELDGYALVVSKRGAKLVAAAPVSADAEAAGLRAGATRNADGSSTIDMGKRGTQTIKFDQEKWATHYERSRITMDELATMVSTCMGSSVRKVVNETGIAGVFQMAWDCPMEGPRHGGGEGGTSDPADGAVLAQSLEAAGLKVEKRKMLMDVYVIDHVERPTAN